MNKAEKYDDLPSFYVALSLFMAAGVISALVGITSYVGYDKALELLPAAKELMRDYWLAWTVFVPCIALTFIFAAGLLIGRMIGYRSANGEAPRLGPPKSQQSWKRFLAKQRSIQSV